MTRIAWFHAILPSLIDTRTSKRLNLFIYRFLSYLNTFKPNTGNPVLNHLLMKSINHLLLFLAFSPVILFSCKTGDKKSAADMDSLQTTYLALQDSVDAAWDTMIKDDDQKLDNADRLLQEISYTNIYDQEKYKKLKADVATLRTIRYTRQSMAQSDKIDQYDSAASQVLYNVTTYATAHPQYGKYPLMKELVDEIDDAQNRVLLMRVDYDFAAKDYNQFIEIHRKLMEEIDPGETVKKKPLFQLPAE